MLPYAAHARARRHDLTELLLRVRGSQIAVGDDRCDLARTAAGQCLDIPEAQGAERQRVRRVRSVYVASAAPSLAIASICTDLAMGSAPQSAAYCSALYAGAPVEAEDARHAQGWCLMRACVRPA